MDMPVELFTVGLFDANGMNKLLLKHTMQQKDSIVATKTVCI